MVQKKLEVNTKLGIQSQSPNRDQDPDCRNKCRVEIKKKMKKSRSFKSADFESLRSPTRRDQSRFKKLTNATATQKKASPNYMKPTSSSDARRESLQLKLQVSLNSQTPSKSKSLRSSNRSKASSASALKPMKVLVRKSSFKQVRPSMRQICGVALHPQLDERRATCSSTLKDSKFPAYVELRPGGTESEGVSVMKVCPYTYCSLNGHHHAPLPPLKRFLSAKRHLLKTQKSMKLKGLSSPRKRNSGDGIKEIDTGQMVLDGAPVILESDSAGSVISPHKDEVYSDFFVESFAKPVKYDDDSRMICDGDDDPELYSAETPEVLKEESSDGDGEIPPSGSSESTEAEIEEDDGDSGSQLNELNEENLGRNSALPTAEDDEFDQEEVLDMDNLDHSMQDQEEISSDCCIENYTSKETEIWEGMDEDASYSDAMDLDWEEEKYFNDGIDYSMFSDDESASLNAPIPGNKDPQEVACDSDDSDRTIEEKSEETFIQGYEDAETVGDGAYECNSIKLDHVNESLEINQASYASKESAVLEAEESDSNTQIGIIYSTNFNDVPVHQTEASDKIKPERDNDLLHEYSSLNDDNKEDLYTTKQRTLESLTETDQGAFSEDHSSGHQLPDTYSENPELSDGMLEGKTCETIEQVLPSSDAGDAEETKEGHDSCGKCDDGIGQENKCSQEEVINDLSGTPDQSTPATHCTFDHQPDAQNIEEDQDSEKDQDNLVCHYISKSDCSEECSDTQRYGSSSPEDFTLTDDKMQLEDKPMMGTEEPFVAAVTVKIQEKNEATIAGTNAKRLLPETYSDLKAKPRKVGKRTIENCELLKTFNPREPRFLDLEPDPDAEKVDLRHQMMDERKNAEEWMIDYALQQAVNKLAPARKQRVALLVEAFETVAPLPKCEAHLRHSAPSFTHSRPIQACR